MKDPIMRGEMSRDKYFSNEEVVAKILETGTPDEIEEYREFYKLTKEKIDLLESYAKMRRKVLDEMGESVEVRKVEHPLATEEELSMGRYIEQIEPQVREVIRSLRKKGYNTNYSGFMGGDQQIIQLESDQFAELVFPPELLAKLAEKQIEIEVKPNAIILKYQRLTSLDEVTMLWDEIEKVIPDLVQIVEPTELLQSKSFRENQTKLK